MGKKANLNLQNGKDVVDYAASQGAEISQKKDGRVKISTEKGSMVVFDNKRPYSSVDKGNVKRWLKLLGLLLLIGFCTWGYLVISARAG